MYKGPPKDKNFLLHKRISHGEIKKAWEGFLGKFGRIKETELAHPSGTDQNVHVK